MKIELKHLAPYLPYELQLYGASDIWVMHSLGIEEICIVNGLHTQTLSFDDCLTDYSPLLKPLSEFEYDHIVHIKEYLGIGQWCDQYDDFFDVWFDDAESVQKLVLQAPYEIMQFFLECHFDVFGLIPAGLATELS
jgi:hypothetical protein